MLRLALAAPFLAAFLLGGCASTVTTQVTSFHQLADNLQGRRFVVVPSAEQSSSLEFGAYADLVREALGRKGLADVAANPSLGPAELAVSLSYDVTGRAAGVREGTTGYGGFGIGSGGGFSMSGIGIGIGFPIGGGGESAVYQRSLTVQIDRYGARSNERPSTAAPATPNVPGPDGTRIFEARAFSEGDSASIAPVMRAMVEAIFEDFPGQSGKTRVVQLPLDGNR